MNARELEGAAAELRSLRRRLKQFSAGAVLLLVVAAGCAMFSLRVAAILGAGVAVESLAALALWLRRGDLIERLALDPSAYVIPEVARFGSRVAALRERKLLASWITSIVNRGEPFELHLVGRAGAFSQQLETLARELAAPQAEVQPAIAVACRRLLTRPVQSPLYNPNLPEEDLTALLLRIRAGISQRTPAGGEPRSGAPGG